MKSNINSTGEPWNVYFPCCCYREFSQSETTFSNNSNTSLNGTKMSYFTTLTRVKLSVIICPNLTVYLLLSLGGFLAPDLPSLMNIMPVILLTEKQSNRKHTYLVQVIISLKKHCSCSIKVSCLLLQYWCICLNTNMGLMLPDICPFKAQGCHYCLSLRKRFTMYTCSGAEKITCAMHFRDFVSAAVSFVLSRTE